MRRLQRPYLYFVKILRAEGETRGIFRAANSGLQERLITRCHRGSPSTFSAGSCDVHYSATNSEIVKRLARDM